MRSTHPITIFVTWFGSGLLPKAPGTMGSLAALPVVYLCHRFDLMALLAVLTILFFPLGVWASNRYMAVMGKTGDPKEIVIDEVVGQWLVFVAMPLMWLPASEAMFWPVLVAGFITFRFFDILKPWPISWADKKLKGGLGVMLDDVLAALAALATLAAFGHFVLWRFSGWIT